MVSRGASKVAVTTVTVIVIGLMAAFLWRVLSYAGAIRRGDYAALPQFSQSASLLSGSTAASAETTYSVDDAGDPSVGPKDAKLTVVEFLDFQCPYCYEAHSTFRAMQTTYGDRVRFVVRDFPIVEIHPESMQAAEAAGCAQAQAKFWPMHDRLFAQQGTLTRADLDRAAVQSGLDAAAFKTCMDTHASYNEIRQDIAAGTAAGVRGTPTFFFNGRRVEGVIPPDVFERLIQDQLK